MAATTKRLTPPVNAELTAIEKSVLGEPDDYGSLVASFQAAWSGTAPAHVRTRTIFNYTNNGTITEQFDELAIPSSLVAEIRPGDRLTYTRNGVAHAVTADEIEDRVDQGYFRIVVNKEQV